MSFFRVLFLGLCLAGLLLVGLGWWLTPAASLLSVAAASLILLVYAGVGWAGTARPGTGLLRLLGWFGLLAGLVFLGEMALEYALLPKDNSSWGVWEFGVVFALFALAGGWQGYRGRSARQGAQAAMFSAMLASLAWLMGLLLLYYLFRGTERQAAVFAAEGSYADFAQSGLTDFSTFIMEDLFGAVFFHLLLAPLLAWVLGLVAGALAKLLPGEPA